MRSKPHVSVLDFSCRILAHLRYHQLQDSRFQPAACTISYLKLDTSTNLCKGGAICTEGSSFFQLHQAMGKRERKRMQLMDLKFEALHLNCISAISAGKNDRISAI